MIFNFRNCQRTAVVSRNITKLLKLQQCSCVSYVQGQSPEPGVREYFYYIDHQEKKFLRFFFNRLRINTSGKYMDSFPYLSLCGKERNFVRCDDLPIVFTHVIQAKKPGTDELADYFCYNHAGDLLKMLFEPNKVIMDPHSGRVYHPASAVAGGIGLVKSSLAIEFSTHFTFEHGEEKGPTKFQWKNKWYTIDYQWYRDIHRQK